MPMEIEQFKKLAASYNAIPVYRILMDDIQTPVSLFLKLRQKARNPFLFESVEGGEKLARYSFLGRDPYQVLHFSGGKSVLRKGEDTLTLNESYFDALKRITGRYHEPEIEDLPRLTGGAVGFSSYDTVRLTEHLPYIPDDDLELPEAIWAFYDEIYAFDHVKHRIILMKTVFVEENSDLDLLYGQAQEALNRMQDRMDVDVPLKTPFSLDSDELHSNTTREQYCAMVDQARKYIYEGDIFQVVLSQRFDARFSGDRFMAYRALRTVNPSPYLFYLDFDDFALIGSSPEVLVRVLDHRAEILPIAGTRPRGKTEIEDLENEKDLLSDPKELAEHIMLVDLGRNDLSRICKAGTVKVTRQQFVERYSHVMHIVSTIEGDMDRDMNTVDALRLCFPAGTVSGAPKVRAMEIIDEMEQNKRGPYAGAVGYFDFSGNMDTCIAIRTMVATNDRIYIQAGAGIVADSIPENEYEETKNKARALVEALELALSMTVM